MRGVVVVAACIKPAPTLLGALSLLMAAVGPLEWLAWLNLAAGLASLFAGVNVMAHRVKPGQWAEVSVAVPK